MAGKLRSSSLPGPLSILIAGLSLIALASVFFFLLSPTSRCVPDQNPTATHFSTHRIPNPNPNSAPPEYSFVGSLEKFLTSRSPATSRPPDMATAADDGGAAARALDDSIWRTESERLLGASSNPWSELSVIRVYVYEIAKFTYDLLWLFRNTYKETHNLTSNGSPVHRLIEQHSIDYWLRSDLIAPEEALEEHC